MRGKKGLILGLILLAAFLVAGYILGVKNSKFFIPQVPQYSPAPQRISIQATPSATSNTNTSFIYRCEKNKTVLEILQGGHDVNFQGSDSAKLVVSIDGIKQAEGKYWQYLIDDKEATAPANTYICKDEEEVRWELR